MLFLPYKMCGLSISIMESATNDINIGIIYSIYQSVFIIYAAAPESD